MVCISTENQNQRSFSFYRLRKVSVLSELLLEHPRYCLTDVPPQPNSPVDNVNNKRREEGERTEFEERMKVDKTKQIV